VPAIFSRAWFFKIAALAEFWDIFLGSAHPWSKAANKALFAAG
jgi:hypothetical protein